MLHILIFSRTNGPNLAKLGYTFPKLYPVTLPDIKTYTLEQLGGNIMAPYYVQIVIGKLCPSANQNDHRG